jgi:hypothetical protein
MQESSANFSKKGAPTNNTQTIPGRARYARPINLPKPLYLKLLDFLEDKWCTKVVKIRNSFYCATFPQGLVAWLDSPEFINILKIDSQGGKQSSIQIRIEDIELPRPIMVDRKTYETLLNHLVRKSGGGVVRWFNKFYSTRSGSVLAELIASDKIKLFDSEKGLFGVSNILDLKSLAPIQLPQERYLHLLDFLAQDNGEECVRIGNGFYPKQLGVTLRAALKHPATVNSSTANLLNTGILGELVSSDLVKLANSATMKISNLVLKNKVYRKHLYFCASCQSFILISRRVSTHSWRYEDHALIYINSNLVFVPISKSKPPRQEHNFSKTLYKFWGIEKGSVATHLKRKTRNIANVLCPTTIAKPTLLPTRPVSSAMLLIVADVTVDGHVITNEEKALALQRLEARIEQQPSHTKEREHTEQSSESGERLPQFTSTKYDPFPAELSRKLRKSLGSKMPCKGRRKCDYDLPELNVET